MRKIIYIALIVITMTSCNKKEEVVEEKSRQISQEETKNNEKENTEIEQSQTKEVEEQDTNTEEESVEKEEPQKKKKNKNKKKKSLKDLNEEDFEQENVEVEPEQIYSDIYESINEKEIKDDDGQVFMSMSEGSINSDSVDEEFLNDWYYNVFSPSDASYSVLEFKDKPGYGIYADSEKVIVNVETFEDKHGNLYIEQSNLNQESSEVYMLTSEGLSKIN